MSPQPISSRFSSVFDLVRHASPASVASRDEAALHRIYSMSIGNARCKAPVELAAKYNVEQNNHQVVVSITNRVTGDQTWYNQARTQKPQTFTQPAVVVDPTDGGARCDFCKWQQLTAADTWGRVELPHVVTASNLFKYCEPCHGVVLFKHHHPLEFDEVQLGELLQASDGWFQHCHEEHPDACHPFFLWNCLARAGASQFHGHAQVMLSRHPLPTQAALDAHTAAYPTLHPAANYYQDLLAAHRAAGLLHTFSTAASTTSPAAATPKSPSSKLAPGMAAPAAAWAFPSLAPCKDMEVMVLGSSLTDPSFARMLHAALRTLVDRLGCQTFNVGVLNLTVGQEGLEGGQDGGWRPVLAKVVSRGKLSTQASDFGGLEVFGRASIGHTDPFTISAALGEELLQDGVGSTGY